MAVKFSKLTELLWTPLFQGQLQVRQKAGQSIHSLVKLPNQQLLRSIQQLPFLFTGVVVVSYFVDLFKESNTDMWKKIEDKVEIKIGQKLAQYHVERLYTEVFRVLERRVANADSFDSDDMEIILDKGLMVFPQNYKSLGWSYDLPLAILNWMPFMIAGYQHQIKKDIQPVYVNVLYLTS